MGGDCLNTGCVPSKALLAAARAAHDARRAAALGVDVTGVTPHAERVFDWIRDAQRRIEPHDSPERFRGLGVDVIEGTARFHSAHEVEVDGRRVEARHIVIATGTRPAVPPIPGLADVPVLTNENLFTLDRIPGRLLVLGAGVVGLEMAQAFARLGSSVEVIEATGHVLPREEPELVERLTSVLVAEGVSFSLDTRIDRARREGENIVLGSGDREFRGDALLVATGRTANVEALELERAGVGLRDGNVAVDARLRTAVPHIWGAGDVIGGLRFTHVADHEARTVLRNALFPLASRVRYDVVPWVIFTDPELAHVGLTEREARERHGDDVRVWTRPFDDVDRAIADGQAEGMVKLITTASGRLLGGHVLGHGAGSLIAEVALAMRHGLGAKAIATTIHAYPTYPEAIKQAAESWYRSRLTGVTKSLVRWLVRR